MYSLLSFFVYYFYHLLLDKCFFVLWPETVGSDVQTHYTKGLICMGKAKNLFRVFVMLIYDFLLYFT